MDVLDTRQMKVIVIVNSSNLALTADDIPKDGDKSCLIILVSETKIQPLTAPTRRQPKRVYTAALMSDP
jgi:hypothetical protein